MKLLHSVAFDALQNLAKCGRAFPDTCRNSKRQMDLRRKAMAWLKAEGFLVVEEIGEAGVLVIAKSPGKHAPGICTGKVIKGHKVLRGPRLTEDGHRWLEEQTRARRSPYCEAGADDRRAARRVGVVGPSWV